MYTRTFICDPNNKVQRGIGFAETAVREIRRRAEDEVTVYGQRVVVNRWPPRAGKPFPTDILVREGSRIPVLDCDVPRSPHPAAVAAILDHAGCNQKTRTMASAPSAGE